MNICRYPDTSHSLCFSLTITRGSIPSLWSHHPHLSSRALGLNSRSRPVEVCMSGHILPGLCWGLSGCASARRWAGSSHPSLHSLTQPAVHSGYCYFPSHFPWGLYFQQQHSSRQVRKWCQKLGYDVRPEEATRQAPSWHQYFTRKRRIGDWQSVLRCHMTVNEQRGKVPEHKGKVLSRYFQSTIWMC